MLNFLFNSQKILNRSRYPWIDYARGITILLVVYRHVFEGLANVGEGSGSYENLKYLNIFFFSFRMPLFFIVSGIFIGSSLTRKGIGEYIGNRFQTIFYPLMVWGSIQITLQLLFAGYASAARSPFDYLNLLIDPRKIEQFWYLNALFFVSVLYALVHFYGKARAWQQVVLGLILYSISGYCLVNRIHIGLLNDILFFYLFFAIGHLFSDWVLNTKNHAILTSWRTTLIALPFFVLVQHYFTYLNLLHEDDYYVQFQRPVIFAVTALIGGAYVIQVSFLLQKLNVLRFLRVIGYHSLYIYVMHLMITSAIRSGLVKLFGIENIPVLMIVSVTMGVVLPIILYNLFEKMGAWWLFTLKKPTPPVVKPVPASQKMVVGN
ncbi:acyltransferase family protein [Paraflavitalea pollutisoli]|uniref:acyltransferase family protein n=1 Tax=Paraflavitalea pollutisoli TaxID=3034143 RepID=UPI0023EB829A|nr:acyltransferase [Paraflavitalea sp. H1-2-19X]